MDAEVRLQGVQGMNRQLSIFTAIMRVPPLLMLDGICGLRVDMAQFGVESWILQFLMLFSGKASLLNCLGTIAEYSARGKLCFVTPTGLCNHSHTAASQNLSNDNDMTVIQIMSDCKAVDCVH